MKAFITCLLLGALFGMIPPPLPAQQNQNQEIEALKKRVSELEKQLQTVENVEKLDLQAKLADANAKLVNADFGKFERELRDSNNKWLIRFLVIVTAVVAIVGIAFVFMVKSVVADRVEKSLNGFKVAVNEQNVIKNQLRKLQKAHAITMLRDSMSYITVGGDDGGTDAPSPEHIKEIPEDILLEIFEDEKCPMKIRFQAVYALFNRQSPLLVSPLLKFLNSVIDSDSDMDFEIADDLRPCIGFLGNIHTQETYQGLTKFLNRLLTENPKHKDLFLTDSVFSLAWVGFKLEMGDSVSVLRMAIPHLQVRQGEHQALKNLARYFDIFKEPEGIKEILTNHVTSEASGMEDVEARCLELLQKHDPEFVEQWRASETTENST